MGERLNEPQNWRTLVLAFLLWTAHFGIVYAAELILPGDPAVGWIALVAALFAWASLALLWRNLGSGGSPVIKLGLAIAALAILYQTLPAVIG